MAWNPATVDRLRVLWDEGHSIAEISRRMGTSKNAVVGKAHRLNLPARPSPIKIGGAPSPKRERRPGGGPHSGAAPLAEARQRSAAVPRPPPAQEAPPAPPPTIFRAAPRRGTCQWIFGENRTEYRQCGAALAENTRMPYCAEHAEKARAKPKEREVA